MRIALVATHFKEYAARLALALSRHHQVQLHLAHRKGEGDLTTALSSELIRSVELVMHPQPSRKAMLLHGARIAWHIERFGADLLHAQEAAPYTVWALSRPGIVRRRPFVLTVHDPKPHSGTDKDARRHNQWATDRIRRSADALIVHGQVLIEDLLGEMPDLAGRVRAVPHGILGDLMPVQSVIPENRFLFFGRIEEYKGLGVLIDAVQRLSTLGLPFRVIIAGRGPDLDRYRDRIEALANVMEIDERYIPDEEVTAIFAAACAIVMPYTDATQSGVAAYAMPSAKPVIASRVGSIPEVIEDGVNGLLVPPRDPEALAEAMRRILVEPGLQRMLAEGAARTARTLLSWDSIALETLDVYAAAVRHRREH